MLYACESVSVIGPEAYAFRQGNPCVDRGSPLGRRSTLQCGLSEGLACWLDRRLVRYTLAARYLSPAGDPPVSPVRGFLCGGGGLEDPAGPHRLTAGRHSPWRVARLPHPHTKRPRAAMGSQQAGYSVRRLRLARCGGRLRDWMAFGRAVLRIATPVRFSARSCTGCRPHDRSHGTPDK